LLPVKELREVGVLEVRNRMLAQATLQTTTSGKTGPALPRRRDARLLRGCRPGAA